MIRFDHVHNTVCIYQVIACEDEFLARVGTTRLTFEAGIIPEMTVRRLSRVCR